MKQTVTDVMVRMRLRVVNVADVAAYGLCQGCGACAYACGEGAVELRNFIDEGIRPVVDAGKCKTCGQCLEVCSGFTLEADKLKWDGAMNELANDWGPVLEVWEGHAGDEEIWFRGGSGGAATALALYCVEREGAAGVLHVGMDEGRPWLNKTVVSRSRQELLGRTGSRYAPAAVCADLGVIEKSERPMVLVAKPCDVAAAQMARRIRPELDRKLSATISIFCAGTPSTSATLELMEKLGVKKEEVADVRYRGYGWPGMTGVGLKDGGERREVKYREAWDHILTKRIAFRCKICPDGTGAFADIAVGDPWYREIEEGEKGSNLILVRTERGRELLGGAMAAGYVVAEKRGAEIVAKSQAGLHRRRMTLWPKMVWARLVMWPFPTYSGFRLFRSFWQLGFWDKVVSFYRAGRYLLGLRRKGARHRTAEEVAGAEVVRGGERFVA